MVWRAYQALQMQLGRAPNIQEMKETLGWREMKIGRYVQGNKLKLSKTKQSYNELQEPVPVDIALYLSLEN